MPGRFVRSATAERVAEMLGSREGRNHLSDYGWTQGMPVVMAAPMEPLEDVMGLASMHGRPVLVATIDPTTDELKFIHLSMPNASLHIVDETKPNTRTMSLFDQAFRVGTVTFRVKYWTHSAVAHPIPVFRDTRMRSRLTSRQHVGV